MQIKRRRGNLLITVVVLFVVVLTLSALFSLSVAQKANARANTQKAGSASSYVTIANLCADAFKNDLEGQSASIATASVDNPTGDFGLEVYDEAATTIQHGLTFKEGADGSWQHTLTNPSDIIEYAGIMDDDVTKLLNTLLKDAKVSITVESVLSVVTVNSSSEDAEDVGNSFKFDDIYYRVVLTKGTWKITQDYCLKNEKLIGRFDDTLVDMRVNGDNATNKLISQTVTSKNIEG